jgi:hypothetical protein
LNSTTSTRGDWDSPTCLYEFHHAEIVTRMPDKSFHRTTYGNAMRRSR